MPTNTKAKIAAERITTRMAERVGVEVLIRQVYTVATLAANASRPTCRRNYAPG